MRIRVAVLMVVCVLTVRSDHTFAQSLPEVPLIPRQERLLDRNDLTARLRVSDADITAGEVPQLTLVLTNQSGKRLRVTNAAVDLNVSVQVLDSNGEHVPPRSNAIIDRVRVPVRVQTIPLLPAGRSREFALNQSLNAPGALPVGEYLFRVTYVNWAGWPEMYDAYERGADEVWEGELLASVVIRVQPVDPAHEQRLIEQVRDGSRTDAEAAMRVLGLSRATAAIAAIAERTERDHSTLPIALESLSYMRSPSAARAVAAARVFAMAAQRDILELARAAACEGLVLGSLIVPTPQSAELLRGVCREAADLLRAEALSRGPAQTLTREQADRRQWAASMLKWLESSDAPPPGPAVYPHRKFPPPPAGDRLAEYVAAIIGFPGGHTERVQVEVSGIARFGTHDSFGQLRMALATATGDAEYAISEALRALAFEDEVLGPSDRAQELRRWDRWWRQNSHRSREQWALRAISRRPASTDVGMNGASRAAEYLMTLDRARYERVLVSHPSWVVRETAAVVLAPNEPQYAAALLLRELENRYLAACTDAGHHLASLTESWFPFNCYRSRERRAAAEHWSRLAGTLAASGTPRK